MMEIILDEEKRTGEGRCRKVTDLLSFLSGHGMQKVVLVLLVETKFCLVQVDILAKC